MRTGIGILTAAVALGGLGAAGERYADPTLRMIVEKSYLELFQLSDMEIAPAKFADFRERIEEQRRIEQLSLQQAGAKVRGKCAAARAQLAVLNRDASRDTPDTARRRALLHSAILDTERDLRNNDAMQKFGLNESIGNDLAKVYLAERWPARRAGIERAIAAGRARDRAHGDIEDIGIRKADEAQKRDIRIGLEGIREMEGVGLLPPAYPPGQVTDYVQGLADRIAANSDARVPVRLQVLSTPDIDAFALPGGFVFVTAGLVRSAGSEGELAGVLGHEIAHIAARHGQRLTEGLSIRNVVSEGAQMAANVFSGGATGTAKKYAAQYGFLGIGTALNLRLLGVNPEFEAEANQLGLQYLWRAGYDPRGFLTFFDKMASEPGSLRAISFFHTHPPYPDALLAAFSELAYLPGNSGAKQDSPEFHRVQELLAQQGAKADAMWRASDPEFRAQEPARVPVRHAEVFLPRLARKNRDESHYRCLTVAAQSRGLKSRDRKGADAERFSRVRAPQKMQRLN